MASLPENRRLKCMKKKDMTILFFESQIGNKKQESGGGSLKAQGKVRGEPSVLLQEVTLTLTTLTSIRLSLLDVQPTDAGSTKMGSALVHEQLKVLLILKN